MFYDQFNNQGGYNYQGVNNGAQPMQKIHNTLTAEEIQKLRKKENTFNLALTKEEVLRGICFHRNESGIADTLYYDAVTGDATCNICGYRFKPLEAGVPQEQIKEDVQRVLDILQSIKLLYPTMSPEAAKEYFQIIPLIEKIPELFAQASAAQQNNPTDNWNYNNGNMTGVNMFDNLTKMFGGGNQYGNQTMKPQYENQYGNNNPYNNNPYNNQYNNGYGNPYGNNNPYNNEQNQNGLNAMNNNQMPGTGFGYRGANNMEGNFGMNQAPQGPNGNGYTPSTNGYSYKPDPNSATTPAEPTTPAPAPKAEDKKDEAKVTTTINV